jgi:hypothetical protein
MDIAYIHLRNIKWTTKRPAHLGGNSARSIDDSPAGDDTAAAEKTKESADKTNESGEDDVLQDDCDFTKMGFRDRLPLHSVAQAFIFIDGRQKSRGYATIHSRCDVHRVSCDFQQ